MGLNQSKENIVSECRIVSLNMQLTNDELWLHYLSDMVRGCPYYVLCLQEIHKELLPKIIKKFNLKLYRYNNFQNTCVLTSFEFPPDFTVDSVHLNDIPASLHLLQKINYEGHTFDDYKLSYEEIRDWAYRSRVPEIKKYLSKHIFYSRSIIAGDFNETSEYPVADIMKSNNYIDFGKATDNYTWPVYPFYQEEPPQRIDFIYGRGITLQNSFQYYKENWLSDHVAVISDIRL